VEKRRKREKIRRGKNVINSFVVIVIMLIFVGIMMYQIHNLKEKNSQLTAEREVCQKMYDKEVERKEELEEQKVYVQTKEYIEEAAKKLGFVYPEEIIFKPADK
jgi:cell division protein DivIC